MSKSIDNDDVACLTFWHGNYPSASERINKMLIESKYVPFHDFKPSWIGVDWASDSGMLRGDVIKREGNVVYLRFKTVGVTPDGKLI